LLEVTMTTTVVCPHGHLVALTESTRRALACPRCGVVFSPEGDTVLDEPMLRQAMAARPQGRPRRDEDEDEEDDDDRRPKRKPRGDSGPVKAGPPPRRQPARSKRPPDEEDEDEDEEEGDDEPFAERKLTRKQRQMSMVRLGVLFHIIKMWVYLAAILFGFITMPLVLFLAAFGASWLGRLLVQITFNLGMSVAPIAGVVGSILCIWVPARSEARGTMVVSLIFDLLAPVFGIFQLIMWIAYFGTGDRRIESLVGYMWYARMACTLIAWWLIQIYLRKLSFYMQQSLLASESLNVIVHLLMACVITPALVVTTFVMALFGFGGLIITIMFFASLGWMIYFLITFPLRQFRLLFAIRNRIWEKYLKPDDD
jgi:hypothetical protein